MEHDGKWWKNLSQCVAKYTSNSSSETSESSADDPLTSTVGSSTTQGLLGFIPMLQHIYEHSLLISMSLLPPCYNEHMISHLLTYA